MLDCRRHLASPCAPARTDAQSTRIPGGFDVRGRPVVLFASVALAVSLADLGAKQLALAALGDADLGLGAHARLVIVHNPRMLAESWFGVGGPTIEAIGLVALLALMCRLCEPLGAIDRRSPYMLGLIGGAALGNTLDLLSSASGVTDFLAFDVGGGAEIVFNLADVAAYVGAALALRLSVTIAHAIAVERKGLVLHPSYSFRLTRARGAMEAPRSIPVFDETAPAGASYASETGRDTPRLSGETDQSRLDGWPTSTPDATPGRAHE